MCKQSVSCLELDIHLVAQHEVQYNVSVAEVQTERIVPIRTTQITPRQKPLHKFTFKTRSNAGAQMQARQFQHVGGTNHEQNETGRAAQIKAQVLSDDNLRSPSDF